MILLVDNWRYCLVKRLLEKFGTLKNLTLTYVGDGNNILHSLLLLAPQLGVNIHYCCPKNREPENKILEESMKKTSSHTGKIRAFSTPKEAVIRADSVYTDVWTSMGFKNKRADHLFSGFQVNEALMSQAKSHAIFMHCLPMEREKEVSNSLVDSPCSVVFKQSENRLHIQKALLLHLFKERDL